MACTANVLLEVEDIVTHRFYYFIQARPGFEANGVGVQLHVDVRMCQKAGTQTTKLKSAKSFVEVHPRKCIPSKYTRYTVCEDIQNYSVCLSVYCTFNPDPQDQLRVAQQSL